MNNSRADALSVDHKNNLPPDQHVDEETDHSLFSNAEMLATLTVLLSGLALTAFAFNMVGNSHRLRAQDIFDRHVTDAVNALSSTLERDTNLVKSLQGLFHASGSVSRSEFNRYLESIDAKQQFPGVAGISWNAVVPVNTLNTFENSVRADTSLLSTGYPEFEVRPVIDNEVAVVVTYIEPMQGNEGAFGFNIASNPERLAAVEEARDTGQVVISAPITLAQESGSQKGFLMMLPTYDSLKPLDLAERRLKFNGLVVGVFRVGDLIEASFESTFSFFQIRDTTDGGTLTDQNLIYSVGQASAGKNLLQLSREIEVGGRSWVLSFEQSQQAHAANERWIEIVIFSLGILVSLLAASLFSALASSRRRALLQAQKLTVGLNAANQDLSRSNADLSQFAHVASHDLQTPVRNVISAVELLEDHLGSGIDAETEEYLEFLRKSSKRMRALVSELLEYARLGRDAILFESVDLDELLHDVRQSTSELCRTAGAELIIGKLPRIVGDARQLQRVFDNLVINAIKYGNSSRAPKIVIEHRSDPSSSSGRSKDMIQLLVSDNGQGIDEKFWNTVFVPFKRLHRHDDIAGSGLGLGICKQVIERHGGSIVIESSSDQGTTFLIVLPRKSQTGSVS